VSSEHLPGRISQGDYALSGFIALVVSAASIAGLLASTLVYPAEELRRSFVSNDVVTLVLGVPLLLVTLRFARHDRLVGLLLWPGALLYATYNYIAYAAATTMTWQLVLFLAVAGMSGFAVIRLLTRIDGTEVQRQIGDAVPIRVSAGVLVVLGALFFVRAGVTLVGALADGVLIPPSERGVLVADLVVTPLWVVSGIGLWLRRPFGYATGAGLLFQASMLFVGLLVFFIVQPFIVSVSFPLEDFVAVLVMGCFCFVPFGLFVRGVIAGSTRKDGK
jgi:hypothetical protein